MISGRFGSGAAIKELVRGYAGQAPWSVPMNELNWHTAAALIRERVFRCLTSLKPGRVQIIDGLIDLAAELCPLSGRPVGHAHRLVGQASEWTNS